MPDIRAPIITVMGHIDHGKTTLLDRIRNTTVTLKEPGAITQTISSTFIPKDVILKLCADLLKKFKFNATIPGLLVIDTPGHEAFTKMRRFGGEIADIAILIIDIMEGLMPQTKESIDILKETKTPFIIAINKIDRVPGWLSKSESFLEDYELQSDYAKEEFEKAFYNVISQLSQEGVNADRFDRIDDFTKTFAAIPISAKTGEGIKELLAILTGLTEKFLKQRLLTTDVCKGIILEVKDVKGLGRCLDCIIYDGEAHQGDWLVIRGNPSIVTKIKALIEPNPLEDIHFGKKFVSIKNCKAACGVRIVAHNIENAVAGSEIRIVKTEKEAKDIANQMTYTDESLHKEKEGIVLKSPTIGGLDALSNVFSEIKIKSKSVGKITKNDIIDASLGEDPLFRVIINFGDEPDDEIKTLAKKEGVTIISSRIIYHLIEEYKNWRSKKENQIKREKLTGVTFPAKIRVLPYVFRVSKPAIVGCEVIGGTIKPGYELFRVKRDGAILVIGKIKQIQSEGVNAEEAKRGEKVAVSIEGGVVGRNFDKGDILYTNVERKDIETLLELDVLDNTEKQILDEIRNVKKI
ncbi:MAG: translation initiation factor IF-2 [Candidatus Aenigmarchaeota archaeon]|nr:translation initiation factor IF-2 [Candidatus Aenigmarchaeota archaeon]